MRLSAVVHSLNLIHTDLKPENILLVENGAYTLGPRVSSAAVIGSSVLG